MKLDFGNLWRGSTGEDELLFDESLLILFVVLIVYIVFGAFAEHKKLKFIHETGFGIIIGAIIGFIFVTTNETYYHESMEFKPQFFMLVILPPIIFAGGYNLKKKKFFQNFFYIVVFGLVGTLVNFGVVVGLTTLWNDLGWVKRYSNFESVNLTIGEILIFSATICATDSVAALAMVSSSKYPKLFSVMFGEGMVNDSVSIILFQAVSDLFPQNAGNADDEEKPFLWYTTFELILAFIVNASGALLFGIITGMLGSLITKYFRFLSHNPVIESSIIFFCGFISYVCAEILEISGVIAILVSGITMSHYLYYNLSPTGRVISGSIMNFIAVLVESFLYIYLGVSVWENKTKKDDPSSSIAWSWTFFLLTFATISMARFISIFGTSVVAKLFKKKNSWRLNNYELGMISYAGCIRGAIAYALIQTLPAVGARTEAVQILQSTTLFLVVFTTVFLGGTMPLYIDWSMKNIAKLEGNRNSALSVGSDGAPNNESLLPAAETLQQRTYRSGSQKKWKKIDENYLKPFFIYDYENRKSVIRAEKLRLKQMQEDPEGFIAFSQMDEQEAQQRRQSVLNQEFEGLEGNDDTNDGTFIPRSANNLDEEVKNDDL